MWRIARKIQIIKQYPCTVAALVKSSDKEAEAQQVKWHHKHTVPTRHVAKALEMLKFLTWISDTHFFSYQNYFKNAWDQFAVFHKSVKKKCKDNGLTMILKIYLNCCPDMEHCSPLFCCWNTVTEE